MEVNGTTTLYGATTIYNTLDVGGFNVASDGLVTLSSNARVAKTLTFTANNLRTKGTSADPTLHVIEDYIITFAYANSSVHEVAGIAGIPCDYASGTNLKIRLHWAPEEDNQGDDEVVWGIEYGIFNSGDNLSTTSTTETVADIAGVSEQLQKTDDITINGSGVTSDDVLAFRIFRDPTDSRDTYDYDAYLMSVHICYISDKLGGDMRW